MLVRSGWVLAQVWGLYYVAGATRGVFPFLLVRLVESFPSCWCDSWGLSLLAGATRGVFPFLLVRLVHACNRSNARHLVIVRSIPLGCHLCRTCEMYTRRILTFWEIIHACVMYTQRFLSRVLMMRRIVSAFFFGYFSCSLTRVDALLR
jgi:hypothetical protein